MLFVIDLFKVIEIAFLLITGIMFLIAYVTVVIKNFIDYKKVERLKNDGK